MFPCKPNDLAGRQERGTRSRRIDVQVYDPKEKQALPPSYKLRVASKPHGASAEAEDIST